MARRTDVRPEKRGFITRIGTRAAFAVGTIGLVFAAYQVQGWTMPDVLAAVLILVLLGSGAVALVSIAWEAIKEIGLWRERRETSSAWIAACQEDAAARPYSSPVAVGWYAEDVPALVALAERADTLERGPCRCDRCRDCVAADGYEEALERADELQRELESAVACAMEYRSEREQARAEADRLREALRFYADLSTYVEGDIPHPTEFATWITPICADNGARACASLAGPQTEEQE